VHAEVRGNEHLLQFIQKRPVDRFLPEYQAIDTVAELFPGLLQAFAESLEKSSFFRLGRSLGGGSHRFSRCDGLVWSGLQLLPGVVDVILPARAAHHGGLSVRNFFGDEVGNGHLFSRDAFGWFRDGFALAFEPFYHE